MVVKRTPCAPPDDCPALVAPVPVAPVAPVWDVGAVEVEVGWEDEVGVDCEVDVEWEVSSSFLKSFLSLSIVNIVR